MRSYFHCVTSRFGRRAAKVMLIAGTISAEAALITFMLFWFGVLGAQMTDMLRLLPAAAGAAVLAGLGVCVWVSLSAEKKVRMNSRYTFADIQLKFAVLSRYDGIYDIDGENAVWRVLCYVPFTDFISAEPSRNGKKIVITGRIREYAMDSDFLGYHIRNGSIEFDRPWLEENSYTEYSVMEFPAVFGNPQKLCDSLVEAKKRFDELPKPKPYKFKEPEIIRKRAAAARTSGIYGRRK